MLIDVILPGLKAEVLVVEEDGAAYMSTINKAVVTINNRDFMMTEEIMMKPELVFMIEAEAIKLAEQKKAV